MELDDLKNSWKNKTENSTETSKNEIMEMIQHKSYGPLASLKEKLIRQVAIIPFVYAILIWKVIDKPELQRDPFFGLFITVILIGSVFFAIAYWKLEQIRTEGSNVKSSLEVQAVSLHKIFTGYRISAFLGVVAIGVFLEVFHNQGTALLMQEWYDVPIAARIAVYAMLIVIGFFAAGMTYRQQFGQHIQKLRELTRQLD
jgi:hypothetical protein